MVCRSAVVLIGFTGVILVFAFSAGAQTSGSVAKKTAAPAGWQEKWVGMYAGQDQAGKVTPPGFKVLYAPEPDTIELVDSLLQPWARARQEATDYELEDPGQICRSTGVLSRNASMDFQLAVSPEKITMIGGTRRGHPDRRNPEDLHESPAPEKPSAHLHGRLDRPLGGRYAGPGWNWL